MWKFGPRTRLFVMTGALLSVQTGNLVAAEAVAVPGTYQVVDGKVDAGTYAGWFTYHLSCYMCHGQDASGTDVAPDLRQSLKTMTPEEFTNKVLERYRVFGAFGAPDRALHDSVVAEVLQQRRGERGRLVMDVWLPDIGEKPHILDLYAYLKGRSDGAIGPGRPGKLEK